MSMMLNLEDLLRSHDVTGEYAALGDLTTELRTNGVPMKIEVHKIENIVSTLGEFFGHPAVKHDCYVHFSTPAIAGDAILMVFEILRAKHHLVIDPVLNGGILNMALQVELHLEGKTEVTDLGSTDTLPESIRPLGPRGQFEIIAHFRRIERISLMRPHLDAVLTACDFDFALRDQDFPPGILYIETGNLVRIRTQRLRFETFGKVVTPDGKVVTPDGKVVTPDGKVVTPKKKGEYLTTLIPRLGALYRDFKATTSGH